MQRTNRERGCDTQKSHFQDRTAGFRLQLSDSLFNRVVLVNSQNAIVRARLVKEKNTVLLDWRAGRGKAG